MVSWYDAVQYCNWLSQQEVLTPAYIINGTNVMLNSSANGFCLPTEAEWEYACRAGTTTPFNIGNNILSSQANIMGSTNYDNEEIRSYRLSCTTSVGSLQSNHWGLYDMHGNIWELERCSFSFACSASRNSYTPSGQYSTLGFRVVRP
jgi:formylglycine-generating enzyme required for sulfatase activity